MDNITKACQAKLNMAKSAYRTAISEDDHEEAKKWKKEINSVRRIM